jgi:aerobic-type carbon monoxide dehydrogenase small subunit (CoxS/CutS family)
VIGSCGPTPVRDDDADALLSADRATPRSPAPPPARRRADPLDDVRGSAEYRRLLIPRLLLRAVRRAEAAPTHERDDHRLPGSTRVELDINGVAADVRAGLSTTLLTVLRDELHLTAAKRGCNQGVCGACTVEIDGVPMRSCLSLAHGCVERPVRTLEGLVETPRMQALQRAFAASGAFQCGFCTPGMLVAAHALLGRRSGARRSGDPARPLGQPLPLHRLRAHRRRGAGRGRGTRRRGAAS